MIRYLAIGAGRAWRFGWDRDAADRLKLRVGPFVFYRFSRWSG